MTVIGASRHGSWRTHRLQSERKAAVRVDWFAAAVGARWEGAVGIEEASIDTTIPNFVGFAKAPWNKGRLIGQKRPLKPKDVWAIRVRLQLEDRKRDLALFNLAIDSKLRGCDLVSLKIGDVCAGGRARERATVIQRKTGRPVQFEITEQTRSSIRDLVIRGRSQQRALSFPEPRSSAAASLDPTIRPHRAWLDRECRARQLGLRHPFYAADEGGADLSENRQFASGAVVAGPYKAGEHRPISRDRGGRCSQHR